MTRLNLTLDDDTAQWLAREARREGAQQATLARRILREGLAQRRSEAQRRKLEADYAAEAAETRRLLADLEPGQVELLGEEDD